MTLYSSNHSLSLSLSLCIISYRRRRVCVALYCLCSLFCSEQRVKDNSEEHEQDHSDDAAQADSSESAMAGRGHYTHTHTPHVGACLRTSPFSGVYSRPSICLCACHMCS